jgi:broad-specificity NMP kinase
VSVPLRLPHADYGGRVAIVLVTGMSGAGKSTVLAELARRGHAVVETDEGGWCVEEPVAGSGRRERLWREDRVAALLDGHRDGLLFVSGTVPNQSRLYPRFDAVVLLTAPLVVLLERIRTRTTNDYGKSGAEVALVVEAVETIEPLLRRGATAELDTRRPVGEVADELEAIARASTLGR